MGEAKAFELERRLPLPMRFVPGAIFLAAAIMGETQHRQFRDGRLILSRRSLMKERIGRALS